MNVTHFYLIPDFMVKFHPETGNDRLLKELDILSSRYMGSSHLSA